MEAFFFLFPLSFFLSVGALLVFLWSARGGQFDDLEAPAHRLLVDDEFVAEE